MRKEAMLWEKMNDGNNVRCNLCSHACIIVDGNYGVCGLRQNDNGELFTFAYGNVIARNVDPIEKKPLYHFLPGSSVYSIAVVGCNFKCSFCQNWSISQFDVSKGQVPGDAVQPAEIVNDALERSCRSIAYTYTEPTIFFEYAYETSIMAREQGLYNSFVTNGYMTEKAVLKISPYLDAANVDLKSFSDGTYRKMCGARLDPVLSCIGKMKEQGIWVEVTTLIIPEVNDSTEELTSIAKFVDSLGPETPWHVSRFHPDHEYTDAQPTPLSTIEKAVDIGKSAGLKYVYPGNVPEDRDTLCAGCGAVLIKRSGFSTELTECFTEEGKCLNCNHKLEGTWKERTEVKS